MSTDTTDEAFERELARLATALNPPPDAIPVNIGPLLARMCLWRRMQKQRRPRIKRVFSKKKRAAAKAALDGRTP